MSGLPPEPAKKRTTTALEEMAEEVGIGFVPNRAQRALKARFWTLLANSFNPRNPHEMTNMEIAKVVRDNRVLAWFGTPGFKDWFMNSTEHIERLEYLFDLALQAAEDVLLCDDPKAMSARVNMVRVIAELAKKMPSKGQEQYQDEKIAKMSKEELEKFLADQGVKVQSPVPPRVLDVTATRDIETEEWEPATIWKDRMSTPDVGEALPSDSDVFPSARPSREDGK